MSGAKNSVLPILAACLLSREKSVIKNVPAVADVSTIVKILKALGAKVNQGEHEIEIEPQDLKSHVAPYKFVSTMRASICVLGPVLARLGKARVSLPGGCVIGPRPVDLHLKGIKALGADIEMEHGDIIAHAHHLKGNRIFLGGAFGSSVLATANVMMAATLAKGKTVIENAACEPEVVDLSYFLVQMGAKITGMGSPTIEIEGVGRLHGALHTVIPDRIETGTLMMAAGITGGDISIRNSSLKFLGAAVDKLRETGLHITEKAGVIRTMRASKKLKPVSLATLPYPGFPTDLQAQMMALLCLVNGISVITEKIYPRRFIHVSELSRMGANVMLEGPSAIINGVKRLSGAPVMASDLRASAALALAGLVAEGPTEISRVYHLDRGYENLVEKLKKLGADIRREKENRLSLDSRNANRRDMQD